MRALRGMIAYYQLINDISTYKLTYVPFSPNNIRPLSPAPYTSMHIQSQHLSFIPTLDK
jgi:hypothetical protein